MTARKLPGVIHVQADEHSEGLNVIAALTAQERADADASGYTRYVSSDVAIDAMFDALSWLDPAIGRKFVDGASYQRFKDALTKESDR
jgi:hypothetical protein